MKPILSSFIRELNCFKLIDLLVPYSSNKLATKDLAAGPLMLRASSWEKTWQSVLGIKAKMDNKATTQPAFADSIAAMFDQCYNASKYLTTCVCSYTWNWASGRRTWRITLGIQAFILISCLRLPRPAHSPIFRKRPSFTNLKYGKYDITSEKINNNKRLINKAK